MRTWPNIPDDDTEDTTEYDSEEEFFNRADEEHDKENDGYWED